MRQLGRRSAGAAAPYLPVAQIRATSVWLVVSLLTIFLTSFMFDVAVIIFGPLVIAGIAASGLLLGIRGIRLGWQQRSHILPASIAVLSMILGGMVLAVLFRPMIQLGGYMQAQMVLFKYKYQYEVVIAHPDLISSAVGKQLLAQVGGTKANQIFVFSYGGFLSIDRDIVYDPLDQPERRSVMIFKASNADCRHLRGHFYDCTLDY